MMKNDDYQTHLRMLKSAAAYTKECASNLEALFAADAMAPVMEKINTYVEKANVFMADVDSFSDNEKEELIPLVTDFFQAMEVLNQRAVALNEMDQEDLIKIRKHEKTAVAYAKVSGGYH